MYRSGSGHLYRSRTRVREIRPENPGLAPDFFCLFIGFTVLLDCARCATNSGVTLKHFITVDNPEAYIQSFCEKQSSAETALVSLRFELEQYYFSRPTSLALVVVAQCCHGTLAGVAIGAWSDDISKYAPAEDVTVRQWAGKHGLPYFDLREPLQLEPIAIPKPWGREIWYTGIEARGQSRVSDGEYSIPLPWLLEAFPKLLSAGKQRELNLLKVLDPLPEEVFGDLYFEQHQEKQEVYVVTHVDEQAWPNGEGGIRIGFNPDVRREFASESDCKEAFADSVKKYESIRREIDDHIDGCRARDGVGSNDPVMSDIAKRWLETVPENLQHRELQLRHAMDRFKGVKPLRVGDVVKVPTYTPHSLMHGVRTIEFQTPVYERQIISFAQKVLTQSHWDTDAALTAMRLDMPDFAALDVLEAGEGYRIDSVVDFDSFFVWRLTLDPGCGYELDNCHGYAIAIAVSEGVVVGSLELKAEAAALLPCLQKSVQISNNSSASTVVLLSFPK